MNESNKCCYCGYELTINSKFCPACGFPVEYHHPMCKCVIIDDPLDDPKILSKVKRIQEEKSNLDKILDKVREEEEDERGFRFSKEDQETYK